MSDYTPAFRMTFSYVCRYCKRTNHNVEVALEDIDVEYMNHAYSHSTVESITFTAPCTHCGVSYNDIEIFDRS